MARLFRADQVRKTLGIFFKEGEVFEIRALHAENDYDGPKTISGYFNSVDKLIEQLPNILKAKGIYFCINPIDVSTLKHEYTLNQLGSSYQTTKDNNILRRSFMFIDFDSDCEVANRKVDESTTQEELEDCIGCGKRVADILEGKGFGKPIRALSGNGLHLVYKIDLPASDTRVPKLLQFLKERYSTSTVKIDEKVGNPSRITKLYGTKACKGISTNERPHRFSEITEIPEHMVTLTAELIDGVIGDYKWIESNTASNTISTPINFFNGNGTRFNLEKFISDHNISVHCLKNDEDKFGNPRTVYNLSQCPWGEQHGHGDNAKDSCIIQFQNGAVDFKCQHDACASKTWADYRKLYEPDYDPNKFKENIEIRAKERMEEINIPVPSKEELAESKGHGTVWYDDASFEKAICGTHPGDFAEIIREYTNPKYPVALPAGKAISMCAAALSGARELTLSEEVNLLGGERAKVRIYNTNEPMTCAVNVLMVAPKGSGKDIFKHSVHLQRAGIRCVQSFSGEGAFLDLISRSPNVYVYVAEFQKLLERNDAAKGAISIIKELFNNYSYEQTLSERQNKVLKMNNRIIRYCSPTILCGIQPDSLSRKLFMENIDDGFLDRFLIVNYSGPEAIYQANMSINASQIGKILKHYQSIDGEFFACQSPNKEAITDIMDELTHGRNPEYKLEERFVNIYTSKLAIILQGGLDIERSTWDRVKILLKIFCQNYRLLLHTVFEDERQAKIENRITRLLKFIERRFSTGTIPTKRMVDQQKIFSENRDRDSALSQLEGRGLIVWDHVKNTFTPTFEHRVKKIIPEIQFANIKKPDLYNHESEEIDIPVTPTTTTTTTSNATSATKTISLDEKEYDDFLGINEEDNPLF